MELLVVIALIGIAVILFVIYFVFKQVEFIVSAVNLYKKMIDQQERMTQLLFDIRDNTKKVNLNEAVNRESENVPNAEETVLGPTSFCEHCSEEFTLEASEVRANKFNCPGCGKISRVLTGPPIARSSHTWRCSCGEINLNSAEFCRKCGMKRLSAEKSD